jgi:hypothetical protein
MPKAGQASARRQRDRVHRGRENAPFFSSEITYPVENSQVKKTEILTLYEGSGSTPVVG